MSESGLPAQPVDATQALNLSLVNDGETLPYRTKARDCRGCLLKAQCCPKTSVRKIPRSIYEEARDVARALAKTEAFKQSSRDRKRVEMLFAHLEGNVLSFAPASGAAV